MRVSALVIWRILHKRATVWEVIDKGWAQGKGVLVEWEVKGKVGGVVDCKVGLYGRCGEGIGRRRWF